MPDPPPWRADVRCLGGSREKEEALFARHAEEIRAVARSFARQAGSGLRAQHAKTLAGIQGARFQVAPEAPVAFQVGPLRPGADYPAIVRFSNAAGEVRASDADPDLRGVAVRVLVDSSQWIDLLMTNAERHHARDAEEAMAIVVAFATPSPLRRLFTGSDPVPSQAEFLETALGVADRIAGIWRLVRRVGLSAALRMIRTVRHQMAAPVESLATEHFYSRAPLAVGSIAVKYRLAPLSGKSAQPKPEADLGAELQRRVREGDVSFAFQVQQYVDPQLTPLEDATVAWSSPFETIAHLVIPRTTPLDTAETGHNGVDHLAFNPWNLPDEAFEPLGSMNRARLPVYRASAQHRGAAEN